MTNNFSFSFSHLRNRQRSRTAKGIYNELLSMISVRRAKKRLLCNLMYSRVITGFFVTYFNIQAGPLKRVNAAREASVRRRQARIAAPGYSRDALTWKESTLCGAPPEHHLQGC